MVLALPVSQATVATVTPALRWREQEGSQMFALFMIAHTLVWALVPLIVRWPGSLWDDMLENYAWGQEWQLGYYKHPPLYSWIVDIWFHVFPRMEWAYYLLSAVNVGIGFVGVWALAGRFVGAQGRLLCVLLLAFMPYYNYMASNFNANTVLLSLWPWTAYAFIRSMETRTVAMGALFGVLAAAGLLSKYYSILLLLSCFVASLAHPLVRRYYTSPAPYVAVVTAAILFAPHIWWAIENGLPPVKYALSKTGQEWEYNFWKAAGTALTALLINFIAASVLIIALKRRTSVSFAGLWRRLLDREHLWLVILALGPFLLTTLLGSIGYVKVSINFLIPAVFMMPILFTLVLEPVITREAVRGVLKAVCILLIGATLTAPAVAYITFTNGVKGTQDINNLAAADAATKWHAAFKVPVRIVSGQEKYSLAQPFYGPDSPSEFSHFDFGEAPWITPDRIAREGLLSICPAADTVCLKNARGYANAATREVPARLQRTFLGASGPVVELIYVMTPPKP